MSRFRLPFSQRRARSDAHDEVRLHIEGRIDDLVREGMTRADAEREAIRRFGDPDQVEIDIATIDVATHRRRTIREQLDARIRDARLAVRALARRPTYALAVIVTLGLGMGAAASIYTLLQRVVLDPLPYPAANRLVRFMNQVPAVGNNTEWSGAPAQYFHYAKAPGVEKTGMYDRDAVNIATDGEPWRARLAAVTVSVLDLVGARTAKGRLLNPNDDVPGAPDVALISWDTWRSRFGSDDAIVGKTIRINDKPAEVVGVLAAGVELPPERGAPIGMRTDVWVARRLNPNGPFYNNHTHPLIGRLAAGATLEAVQAQVDQLLETLPENYPNAYRAGGVGRAKFWTKLYPLQSYVLGDTAKNLWIAFVAVILVLIIACANVGNLFLVRLETQRQEFAVRTALGAARSDIAFEAFGEGLVLVTGGAALATVLGVATLKWLVLLAPSGIPRLEDVSFGWNAAAFLVVVAIAIAVAFALIAAAHYRGNTAQLGEGGRSSTVGIDRQRVRGALVATQVALALMLVVGAGLLLKSFARLREVDPGVDPHGVLTAEWFLPRQRYDSVYKAWRFDRDVLARVRALPGVASAGAADILPLYDDFGCTVQGFEEQAVRGRLNAAHLSTCAGQGIATPGFFEALKIPLVTGRYFTDDDNDDPSKGAVVVTKAFADRFWPGENPIGKGVGPSGWGKPPFYRVVGVVRDVHGTALDGPPAIGIYYPIMPIMGRFWDANYMRLAVRAKDTNGNSMALVEAVQRAVHEVDPSIPVANAEPMEAAFDRSLGRISFTMLLLAVAGGVALLLAAVGLYGVISYLVVRRTGEIGVRLALGAQQSQVEALVVRGALRMAGAGLVIGIIGAAFASRALSGLLYGVTPWDPAAYGIAVAVLGAVAAVAGWIPARRAARVSPTEALRGG